MFPEKFAAHKTDDGQIQSVKDHLEGTASLCASFAKSFGAEEAGRLCGFAHDIGKYSAGFQRRIMEGGDKVDHASAGAIECWENRQALAAMCVMGHHGGLMNMGVRDDSADSDTFYGRLKRYQNQKKYDYSKWKDEISLPPQAPHIPNVTDNRGLTFFTRMLYSCLVDADFLDTASFMGEPRPKTVADWDSLNNRLDAYTQGWYPPERDLNRIRCAILDTCKAEGEAREESLFTLTVPTGGGKTVSSLAFALRHARKMGKDRIIYVIPYTSIIEQTAEVFREILGDDMVLEHHSGVVYDEEDGILNDRQKRLKFASENWDMPIIVTTAVQFFESLFSNKPSQCRKLHNISNSVVIFDEAQMLPIPCLHPCVYAISELARAYNVTAVMCTATQPALDDLFEKFCQKTPREICPPELCQGSIFKRVTFKKRGKLSTLELAEELNQKRQILCIVNSREAAQEMYGLLEEEGRFHLSTLMPPAERQAQLKIIRQRLDNGEACRVVSTSLIEAGVDLDFPTVYREIAGLDSILQAAGRCNRNGVNSRENSEVMVFEAEWTTPRLIQTSIDACDYVWNDIYDPSDEKVIHRYFEELLFLKGDEAQDTKGIMKMMINFTLLFADIAKEFHMIDSNAVTVYIPTEESRPLVEQYRSGSIDHHLMRKLGRFGVTIYPNRLQALLNAGDVEALDGNVYVLLNEELYDKHTGLSMIADQGKAIFC